jgi:hypothetical protein
MPAFVSWFVVKICSIPAARARAICSCFSAVAIPRRRQGRRTAVSRFSAVGEFEPRRRRPVQPTISSSASATTHVPGIAPGPSK